MTGTLIPSLEDPDLSAACKCGMAFVVATGRAMMMGSGQSELEVVGDPRGHGVIVLVPEHTFLFVVSRIRNTKPSG